MRLRGAKLGSMIGGLGGLLFVLINAADLPGVLMLRIVGVAAFVAVVIAIVRAPEREAAHQPGSLRTYWISVAAMVVGLVVGGIVLRAVGLSELQLAWVVLVVGLHFVPFARAFGAPVFLTLAAALVAVAVIGAIATLAGSDDASAWTGVAAGFVLLGVALAGVAFDRGGGTVSPYAGRTAR